MSSEWPSVRLGDYIDSSLGKMLDAKKNKGTPQPYLGNSNVRWGEFDLTVLAKMRFESDEEERYGLCPGDLVVCEGGEPGRCAIWNGPPGMKFQNALHRIRPKSLLDNHYLFNWFRHAARTGQLDAHFTGTTIKHLTGKAVAELRVQPPPLSEQKAVVDVLKPLDDRIALLRETRAGDEGDGSLEVLARLRTHAKRTPWMDAVLDTIDRRVAERKRASKAIGFARDIGLGDLKSFWLEQWVSSTARNERGEGRYWSTIMVFCTEVAWFHVSLNETAMGGGPTLRQSNYDDDDTQRDDFGLGALKPEALPQWLQRAGKQLGTQWQFGTFRTSLRGKKRAQLSAWLRGSE